MGLPDLYATKYTDSFTPGPWSTLDYGPYNNEGRTPPVYTAFERYCVGWMQPEVITGRGNFTLPPMGNNKALMIKTDSPDEFYLIENRQQNSWDTYLPNHGMLVWHIDFDQYTWDKNLVNNDPSHQRVDLVEADDIQHIDNREGDCFPGTANVTSFTDDTQPSMKTWAGHRLSLPITDICETPGGFLSFKVLGGYDAPEAPANLRVTATTSRSVTLTWDAVEGATGYKATAVRQGTFLPVEGCDGVDTAGATEVTLTGLTPSTPYTCYVVATGAQSESVPTAPVDVTTDLPGFSDLIPVATEASDITASSFTASWEAVEGATGYLLTVYTKEPGDPFTQTCDFTGGVAAMPEGWYTNVKSTYSMATYAGKAVPSLRLNSGSDMVETAEYPDGIHTFSFWHRGSGSSSVKNTITVLAKTGAGWAELQTIPVINTSGGQTTEVTGIPEGCTAMRLVYNVNASASLAIDDITVGHGAQIVDTPIEGYDRADVGNTTTHSVEGLTHSTDYYYTVEATDGTTSTGRSNEVGVTTTDNSGIGETPAAEAATLHATVTGSTVRISAAPDTHYTISDPAGRITASGTTAADGSASATLAPGLYILSDGSNAIKLIVRN